ncbi:hypothetical protein OF83DRAFT_1050919 [Amylostereum chailletii]|nr:hypothetical protein OF83DRAFT_1050919 [Amylostereum chailletii]
MLTNPVRRSARLSVATKKNYLDSHVSYPDGPPSTTFECSVAALNNESFPHKSYSGVDDMLVYALFAAKRRPRYSRAFLLSSVSQEPRPVTREDGIKIHAICHNYVDKDLPTREQCRRAAVELVQSYPTLFYAHKGPVVQQ